MLYEKRIPFWILLLASVGVLFSGYLSVPMLFTGTCPVWEGCHSLFGFPACVLSLILFLALLAEAILLSQAAEKKIKERCRAILLAVSGMGMMLLGYITLTEALYSVCQTTPCPYTLFAPLCIYGFVFYALIFYLARGLKQR